MRDRISIDCKKTRIEATGITRRRYSARNQV
jgi:hypothetical protein